MKRLLPWAILAIGVAVGAFREFIFLNLNYQLDHVRRGTPFSYAHSGFQEWVQGWDLNALGRFKWSMALIFSLCMLALALWMARTLTGSHRYMLPLAGGFLAVGATSLVLHFLAAWVPALERVSVQVFHVLQYPVPLLLLIAASMLARRKPGT